MFQAKKANPNSPAVAMQYMTAKTAHIAGTVRHRSYALLRVKNFSCMLHDCDS